LSKCEICGENYQFDFGTLTPDGFANVTLLAYIFNEIHQLKHDVENIKLNTELISKR